MLFFCSVIVLSWTSCSVSEESLEAEAVLPRVSLPVELPMFLPAKPTKVLVDEPDPYAGWETWCEPLEDRPCSTHAECGVDPDGHGRRCVHPFWAKDRDLKICASHWPTRDEQNERRARLREIVGQVCQRKDGCDPSKLHKFLSLIAARESSWRPWKRHRLNPDIEANAKAWRRMASRYEGNKHYLDASRWQGWGLYGQNAAYHVRAWDLSAPPEILCREVESTLAYLNVARAATRRLAGLGIEVSWCTVHQAVAGGKFRACSSKAFRRQAERAGLDPEEGVSAKDFGRALPREAGERRALAAEIYAALR